MSAATNENGLALVAMDFGGKHTQELDFGSKHPRDGVTKEEDRKSFHHLHKMQMKFLQSAS